MVKVLIAYFCSPLELVEHAVRQELSRATSPVELLDIVIMRGTANQFVRVKGPAQRVMFLIGAIADQGEDSLDSEVTTE